MSKFLYPPDTDDLIIVPYSVEGLDDPSTGRMYIDKDEYCRLQHYAAGLLSIVEQLIDDGVHGMGCTCLACRCESETQLRSLANLRDSVSRET